MRRLRKAIFNTIGYLLGLGLLLHEHEQDNHDDATATADCMDDVKLSNDESDEDEELFEGGESDPFPENADSTAATAGGSSYNQNDSLPLISIRGGFKIWEKVAFSLSVHDLCVRAFYGSRAGSDGSLQLRLKGLALDAMSSRTMKSNDGIIQLSLPFLSIQEKYKTTCRPMLIGGIHSDESVAHKSNPFKTIFEEIHRDDNFPFFEYISIRDDFTSARNFLPIQAVGYKATIRLKDEGAADHNTQNMLSNELGIDRILLILDSEPWCRTARFFTNADNGGFDPRTFSGKWESEITPDMCRVKDYIIDQCVQPLPQPRKSPAAFMTTNARLSNISLRIPAAVQADVWSSDLIVSLDEVMINMSSALPTTFLVGRIGGLKAEERPSSTTMSFSDIVDFPNDPSDLCYSTQEQHNNEFSSDSLRIQISISSLSVKVLPLLSIWHASLPKLLVAPTKITLLLCVESDVPYLQTKQLITQVYFSLLLHKLDINLELEVMASILRTMMHHYEVCESTFPIKTSITPYTQIPPPNKIQRMKTYPTTNNQTPTLLQTQISKSSRRKGSWMLLFCMHIPEMDLRLWIQNNVILNREEASALLLPFLRMQLVELEMGVESFCHSKNYFFVDDTALDPNHLVVKYCCKHFELNIIDFDRFTSMDESMKHENGEKEYNIDEMPMVTLIAVGTLPNVCTSDDDQKQIDQEVDTNCFAVRYQSCKSLLLSFEINGALLHCPMKCIDASLDLLVDTLLLPSGCTFTPSSFPADDDVHLNNNWACLSKGATIFPSSTLGALFESLSCQFLSSKSVVDVKIDHGHMETLTKKDVTDLFLILFFIKNAQLTVYDDSTKSNVGILFSDTTVFFCNLKTTSLPICSTRMLLTQLARCDPKWLERFNENEKGFHLLLDSTQRIVTADGSVAPNISVHCHLKPSRVDTSMDSIIGLLECSDGIQVVQNAIHVAADDFMRLRNRMCRRLNLSSSSSDQSLQQQLWNEKHLSQLLAKCEEASESCHSSSKLLAKLKSVLFDNREVFHNSIISEKENELKDLRTQVFLKERQRVAAVSLLSIRKCGWVRFGGISLSGQRFVKSATCHQYWLVLTENNLIVAYKEPGQAKPLDFIVLNGAHVLSLSWGSRSCSNKHGFVIVDSNGRERVLLFRNGRDFDDWLKEIGRIVDLSIMHETNNEKLPNATGPFVNDTDNDAGGLSSSQSSATSMNFRNKVANMSSQVKNSMSGVVDLSSLKEKTASVNSKKNVSKVDDEVTELNENETQNKTVIELDAADSKKLGDEVSSLNTQLAAKSINFRSKIATMSSQVKNSMVGVVDISSSKETSITVNDIPVSVDASACKESTPDPHFVENFQDANAEPDDLTCQSSRIISNEADSLNIQPQPTVRNKMLSVKANIMKQTMPPSIKVENSAAHVPTISTSFRDKMSFKTSSKYFKMPKSDPNASKRSSISESMQDVSAFTKRIPSLGFKSSSNTAEVSNLKEESASISSNKIDFNEDSNLKKIDNAILTDGDQNVLVDNTEKLNSIESSLNQNTALTEIQSSNQKHGNNLSIWDVTPSNDTAPKTPAKRQSNILDKVSSLKTSAKQSMDVAVKSVTPDVNALKPLNLHNTSKTPSSDRHENSQHNNILDKMSTMKTNAKQSMQVAVNSMTPDTNALKLLNSGALHHTTQASSSDNHDNSTYSSSLTKLHQSVSIFPGQISDIFSPDQEKQPLKLSNINVGADDVLACIISKITPDDVEMTDYLMKWWVRIAPINSVRNVNAFDTQELDSPSNADVDGAVEDSLEKPIASNSDDTESQFLITVFNSDIKLENELQKQHPVKEVVKHLSDFLSLHANLSMLISGISIENFSNKCENNDTSALPTDTILGVSLQEQMSMVGNLLVGTSICSSITDKNAVMSHQCAILKQFLNLFLSSPIPKNACEKMKDFLNMKNISEDLKSERKSVEESKSFDKYETTIQVKTDNIFNITNALESELIISDQYNKALRNDLSTTTFKFNTLASNPVEPTKKGTINSNSLFCSMQNSLMKVMSERDEAHSQLIGASVLHSYLMQQERKKNERFAAKLDCLHSIVAANNTNPPINMRKQDNQMMQDNETELLSLCRQLSSEISGRTSTSLELARLQESYKLEREQEKVEKAKMEEEIKTYKELLTKEKAKCEEAEKDASHWKNIYEKKYSQIS